MAITFDGSTKVITLTTGTTSLGVRDLWSRWVDWSATSDNSKFLTAMTQVGGNDIDTGAGTKIPIYIFLENGWKIQPQSANHTLNVVDGILLVAGGGDPFLSSAGYTVRINFQQPVQAISFEVGEGGGGGGATADEIATAVISAVVDGSLTVADTMKIQNAINIGKTTIDTVDGVTTVTFRNPSDSITRISSTLEGSERLTTTTNLA